MKKITKIIIYSLLLLSVGIVVFGFPQKINAQTAEDIRFQEIQARISNLENNIIPRDEAYLRDNPNADNYQIVRQNVIKEKEEVAQLREEAKKITNQQLNQLRTAVAKIDNGECSILSAGTWGACAKITVSWIFAIILWLFTRILWLANELFNQAINISVRTFSNYASTPAVQTSWGVIRDLVNMGFIFVLLYIAFSTILGVGASDWKKLVPKLIIVALLVNFSMFFTRVIIDVSNVTANQFYLASASEGIPKDGGAPDVTTSLMKSVDIFRTTLAPDKARQEFSGPAIDGAVVNPGGLDWSKIITGFLGGIVLALVASFVFLTGAILFLIRTLRLLFLIILSPFAFFAFILPKTEKYTSQWWGALMNDATFAPAFLIMIYIVTQITRMLGEVGGAGNGWIGETISFMFIIGLLLGALIVAKALGAAGAAGAMKLAGSANAALTGGTLWGLKQVRRVGVGAAVGATGLAGKPLGIGASARKYFGSQFRNIGTDAEKVWKEKGQSKIAKAYKAVVKAPGQTFLTKASDVLADSSGVSSGFLGNTAQQRRDAEKAQKDAKEAEKEAKFEEIKREIQSLRIGATPTEKQTAKEKVQKVSDKNIVKIDSDSLIRLATLLTDKQMAALEKEIDPDKFNKVKTAREKPLSEALGYNDKGERDATKPVNEANLLEALNKMSHQTIAKLPEEMLKGQEMIDKLVAEDIKEMRKAGVSSGTIDHITSAVKTKGPAHPAYDYATKSPARGIPIRGTQGRSGPSNTPDEGGVTVEE